MDRTYMMYNTLFLGASYTRENTTFSVWSPKADKVELNLYKTGNGDTLIASKHMQKGNDGVWNITLSGDWNKVYYTYQITIADKSVESHDPYAVACGVNGDRSMVIDLQTTDPEGFDDDAGPIYKNKTDIIVMEISVADSTGDDSSNVDNKGKYLGLTETGKKYSKDVPAGLDYIEDMGVTHVQIMPSYDFASIDEAALDKKQYNWGYDPYNYNVPEGSYSTDPFNGEVRIKEFKQMIQAFHKKKIGVIMDVVYNHVYDIEGSCFQKTNPDYYFRMKNGEYSDASACGNEFASDMPMARKYIIDSLCYWVREYHIDGFRFDLMGVLDIETMNLAARELRKINPDIIMYGEGWTGGSSTIPEEKRALKCNTKKFDGIGAFSDDFRDSVKGHVFEFELPGFVNGEGAKADAVKQCILGCKWSDRADKVINYVSCHDNLTLWDKFLVSSPDASDEDRLRMNRLAAAITFTTQGIPFLQMGEEFARTKHDKEGNVIENSYNCSLDINSIKYDEAQKNSGLRNYYKGLIRFRKAHDVLCMNDMDEIRKSITFIADEETDMIAYVLSNKNTKMFIAFNPKKTPVSLDLPEKGRWNVYVDADAAGTEVLEVIENQTQISPISCLVAIKN